MHRHLTYFVADVHLGLRVSDPADREARFVTFLKEIPSAETEALYLLGDIWDFWYEYRDVVPKGYTRVFAALQDLMDAGVKVYFFQGNHDVWTYHYFEELGMVPLVQPYVTEIGGKVFCLGHGDGLGPGDRGYKFLRGIFHNRFLQVCFSTLHPWIAFRLGNGWSRRSRLGKSAGYVFKGADEPLYKFCESFSAQRAAEGVSPVDVFLFGHYHCEVDLSVGESRLLVLRDWISSSNWFVFDAKTGAVDSSGSELAKFLHELCRKRMKRFLAYLVLMLAVVLPAAGQNHVKRAMKEARERQEAMARKIIFDEDGKGLSGYLSYRVEENGDTMYFDTINPIWIFGRKQKKDWKQYYRLVYNFARVYPYALASGRLQEIVDSTITVNHYGRMKKDRYMNEVQKMLFRDFEGALHKMTISQGAVLLKLIDRETGQSSYSIIHDYKNGVAAGFWQSIAKFFDNDLKSKYDPEGADKELEQLVQAWHDGTFPSLYRSIFWEDPPEVKVPDIYTKK